jgi:hypothetical protein
MVEFIATKWLSLVKSNGRVQSSKMADDIIEGLSNNEKNN